MQSEKFYWHSLTELTDLVLLQATAKREHKSIHRLINISNDLFAWPTPFSLIGTCGIETDLLLRIVKIINTVPDLFEAVLAGTTEFYNFIMHVASVIEKK